MSRTLAMLVVLNVLALGMTACGDKTPSERARATGDAVGDAVQATGDAVGDAAQTTGNAVGDAVQATGEYLNQPKDLHVKAAQEKLDTIEQNWQALLARTAPTTDEAKVDLQEARDEMTAAIATARAKLEEAKSASNEDWQQNIKPALDAALQKSQDIYDDASTRFVSG